MSAVAAIEQIQLIDLEKLEVHPANPRKDVGDIDQLAASIKSAGLIEPIVAVRHNGKFQVVAGSRRLAAARKAKLDNVPVRVMELAEAEARAAALIENLQRKDLTPLEEADAFRGWLTLTGKTQKELGDAIGLAPSTIANALRLLEAPKPIKAALAAGEITAAHARVFLSLKDPGLAEKALKDAQRYAKNSGDEHVTVDDVEDVVGRMNEDYAITSPKALADRKAALIAKRDELEKAGKTVSWSENTAYPAEIGVARYLGKPKVKIAAELGANYTRWATHAKDCGCNAVALEVALTRSTKDGGQGEQILVKNVCTNLAAYRKWHRKEYGAPGGGHASKPKPKSPAAIAKALAADAKKAQQDALKALKPRVPDARQKPVFAKIAKASISADLARALVYADVISDDYGLMDDAESAAAWPLLLKMPAKKVAALAASLIAERVADSFRYIGPHTKNAGAIRAAAEHFGWKLAKPKKAKR